MNRATADNQSAQAEEEGLEPTKEWVKDLIDEIITEEFASPDLELVWLSEEDNDLGKNEAALESRVKLGALTLNELRDLLGLDPYANPAADRPMVLTATGFVPIEAGADGNLEGQANPPGNRTEPDTTVARMRAAKFGEPHGVRTVLAKDYHPDHRVEPGRGLPGAKSRRTDINKINELLTFCGGKGAPNASSLYFAGFQPARESAFRPMNRTLELAFIVG